MADDGIALVAGCVRVDLKFGTCRGTGGVVALTFDGITRAVLVFACPDHYEGAVVGGADVGVVLKSGGVGVDLKLRPQRNLREAGDGKGYS